MDKKVIMTTEWYHCYIVSLGVKGDTGDPGTRGPRGIVGKMHIHLYDDIVYQHNYFHYENSQLMSATVLLTII